MSKIEIKKLNCGVRVVMEKIDYVQSAAFGIWVRAGAVNENEKTWEGYSRKYHQEVFR